jgi:hypothetical protein
VFDVMPLFACQELRRFARVEYWMIVSALCIPDAVTCLLLVRAMDKAIWASTGCMPLLTCISVPVCIMFGLTDLKSRYTFSFWGQGVVFSYVLN